MLEVIGDIKMQPHSFHIPVMGTGFTIDTPLKVARYGISSVISLVDDKLIEKIHQYYANLYREQFTPIPTSEIDSRARHITNYLNFMSRIVENQTRELKSLPFGEDNDLTKYFELIDNETPIKKRYLRMLNLKNDNEKMAEQAWLRDQVTTGAIDVNIMTKADRENYSNGQKMDREYSDAMAALRGFANSNLNSSIVFSAGLNLHLYSYLESFNDFYPDDRGQLKKKIILKVSDFRSAFVQAKILAKKGIWISEYRIESGLNCGGHAFATTGLLLGPILDEFKERKKELADSLFPVYRDGLLSKKNTVVTSPLPLHITAQGGVGTPAEHRLLRRYYQLDSVGWGSPFLLVPEATTVDDDTLEKLAHADKNDIYLSNASPLGVAFYNLRNSSSEEARKKRIATGHPGSPCINKFLAFNTEYETSMCVASAQYQSRKLKELKEKGLSESEYRMECEKILEKACICHDLGDGALLKYNIMDKGFKPVPAVCPGPNLVYFSRILSLKEMIDHIYGKINVLDEDRQRPHMFINELRIYINYLRDCIRKASAKMTSKEAEYFSEFRQNLVSGIKYYKEHLCNFLEESESSREKFLTELMTLKSELDGLTWSCAL